jgi:thymidylate synthase (FAD)
LTLSPNLMSEINGWPEEKKAQELAYAAKTIKSSWEFVDLTFLIEGVSRATAQQITRTRNASYAMQSQRVTDVRAMGVHKPKIASVTLQENYDAAVASSLDHYAKLVDIGMPLEDARGVLPMNTTCNLVAKYNLRAFTDLAKARASLRTQGEYSDIVHEMRALVLRTWPWTTPFFASEHDLAIGMLESVAKEIGITTGKGPGWEIAKAVDLLRKA